MSWPSTEVSDKTGGVRGENLLVVLRVPTYRGKRPGNLNLDILRAKIGDMRNATASSAQVDLDSDQILRCVMKFPRYMASGLVALDLFGLAMGCLLMCVVSCSRQDDLHHCFLDVRGLADIRVYERSARFAENTSWCKQKSTSEAKCAVSRQHQTFRATNLGLSLDVSASRQNALWRRGGDTRDTGQWCGGDEDTALVRRPLAASCA
jgi:hypothetical protein